MNLKGAGIFMKTKDRKRQSRYVDELDSSEKKKIEALSLPWQRTFLYRFYTQLQKKGLSKSDVAKNVNKKTDTHHLLHDAHNTDYQLKENTLTQFTNFNNGKISAVSVSNLIAVANALKVSVHYLLGIDTCENPRNTNIHRATGLSNDTINVLKDNKKLQKQLEFFLLTPKLNDVVEAIDKEFYMQLISQDILNAYSTELYKKIESAYQSFNLEVFPLDRTFEKFRSYLDKELSLKTIKETIGRKNKILNYLESNISADIINQIQLNTPSSKMGDEKYLHTIFIDDTAQRTYDILEQKYNKEARLNKIAQSFLSILNDYVQEQVKSYKKSIKNKYCID